MAPSTRQRNVPPNSDCHRNIGLPFGPDKFSGKYAGKCIGKGAALC